MIAQVVLAVDAGQYTVQYELLRSQVIGARREAAWPDSGGQVRGIGLALLLCEGMPGWLKAVEAVACASAAVRTPEAIGPVPWLHAADTDVPAWLSGVPRDDLTTLLASLVLSTRSHEDAPSREAYRSCH
jgi:hypothetical protein